MNKSEYKILVVDDDALNLELIETFLNDEGYHCQCVDSGRQALAILDKRQDNFSCILLDRMMPEMDGMEVLKKIKSQQRYSRLPIIMQTALTGKQNMREGLEAGAYYYLIKPYSQITLLKIVDAAIKDYTDDIKLQHHLNETAASLQMMQHGSFKFSTLEQAKRLAVLLAKTCEQADKVVMGLSELLVNAVEHGNLGISYQEKTQLNEKNIWQQEIDKRLQLEAYRGRQVTVNFKRMSDKLEFTIVDQGKGFDWREYLEMRPERAFNSHGRGIAMAKLISFDEIEYCGNGNEVHATVVN